MNALCKHNIHIKLNYGTEEGKNPSQFRIYRACACQKKKKYLYNGQYITGKILSEHASHY